MYVDLLWKTMGGQSLTMCPQHTEPVFHRQNLLEPIDPIEFSFFTTDIQVLTINSYY